ncbi:MAG: methylated-DNA--[protein]-cysteine S-methyltransferase [Finegoldia magna]|uniref:methylated-DNA--[protein]-cysteine S-methyltransferase n=1 Tax=Finegoldia magna TaxID=1260 RepID=UPI000B9181C1|nr:methylated-DNA--[protein]-cysteine S-methyltransferase [Finegoldia magna]MDU1010067.1 methylated-DNA--[protein]-cysteine S-methyltransferase [Finegoldia magna]MDU1087298.1 methylated-DNA--[protein]-cysteine S-methyltransferase [Finegoldia magna]MDU7890258.1 methylated-DNA--[protein]-cysteine S-methyltransferase [Finegoldia magna]MDU7926431.1 methylated-DNA--[protein]-cysteine S-methyltransferase [Finegoldia magna]OXZ37834.1 cysteine methyltransferase [Finegoldia magna]
MREIYKSKIGNILIESDGENIIKSEFVDYFVERGTDEIIEKCKKYLDDYFSGKITGQFDDILIDKSDYATKILKLVCEIPYGTTTTYTDIKEKYEKIYNLKTSARAVGRAVGSNDLMILVPCHRVIGKNNELTGYKFGIEKKKYLLDLEKNNNLQ